MKISKTLKKSGVLMLSIFMLAGSSVFAAETTSNKSSMNQATLDQVHKGELQARNMYQQMINKFDNDDYYRKLMMAEGRHADSVKRHMQNDLDKADSKSNANSSVSVSVSNDELTALKNAYNFEVNDVKMLAQKIKASKNDDEKRLLNRLKDRSQRHADSLKTAIAQFEKGDKDLNKLEAMHEKNNGERHGDRQGDIGRGQGMKGRRHMDRDKNWDNNNENCEHMNGEIHRHMNGEKRGHMHDNN